MVEISTIRRCLGSAKLRSYLQSSQFAKEHRDYFQKYANYWKTISSETEYFVGISTPEIVRSTKSQYDYKGKRFLPLESNFNLYRLDYANADWFMAKDLISTEGLFEHLCSTMRLFRFRNRFHTVMSFGHHALYPRCTDPELLRVHQEIEEKLGIVTNFCVINYYEDPLQNVGPHYDGAVFQMQAILSVGSDSRFHIQTADLGNKKNGLKNLSTVLFQDGDVLVQGCFSQSRELLHCVTNKGPRFSLQFRYMLFPEEEINLAETSTLVPHSEFLREP